MRTKKSKPEGPKTMMFKDEDLEVINRLRSKLRLEGISAPQVVRVILRRADEAPESAA